MLFLFLLVVVVVAVCHTPSSISCTGVVVLFDVVGVVVAAVVVAVSSVWSIVGLIFNRNIGIRSNQSNIYFKYCCIDEQRPVQAEWNPSVVHNSN